MIVPMASKIVVNIEFPFPKKLPIFIPGMPGIPNVLKKYIFMLVAGGTIIYE